MTGNLKQTYSENALGRFVLKLGLSLMMYKSFMLSITWPLPEFLVYPVGVVCVFLFILTTRNIFSANNYNNVLAALFLVLIQLYTNIVAEQFTIIRLIVVPSATLCACFMIFLRNEIKLDLLSFFTRSLGVILLISLAAWFVFLLGIPLPHYMSYDMGNFYTHTNYYFFLLNGDADFMFIYRFTSIFLEPGHLATTCCLLLYANKFNIKKWEVKLMLLAIFMSLSLAGYVILAGSYFCYLVAYHKNSWKYISLCVILLSIVVVFFMTFNEGDNIMYEKIISRLEFENGEMKGNNRFSTVFEINYDRFIKTDYKYCGAGKKLTNPDTDWTVGSAGWKKYIVRNGIVGAILVLIFYVLLSFLNVSFPGFLFMCIYFVVFCIRDYPLREYWLYIFIVALPYLQTKTSTQKSFISNES